MLSVLTAPSAVAPAEPIEPFTAIMAFWIIAIEMARVVVVAASSTAEFNDLNGQTDRTDQDCEKQKKA